MTKAKKTSKTAETDIPHINRKAELERLYHVQMCRIGIDVKNEISVNKLFPTTTQEVQMALNILKEYASCK